MCYVYGIRQCNRFFSGAEISAFFAKICFQISVVILNSTLHSQIIFEFDIISIQILNLMAISCFKSLETPFHTYQNLLLIPKISTLPWFWKDSEQVLLFSVRSSLHRRAYVVTSSQHAFHMDTTIFWPDNSFWDLLSRFSRWFKYFFGQMTALCFKELRKTDHYVLFSLYDQLYYLVVFSVTFHDNYP